MCDGLLVHSEEHHELKDFRREVRASLDARRLLSDAVVLPECAGDTPAEVIEELFAALQSAHANLQFDDDEFSQKMFAVHDENDEQPRRLRTCMQAYDKDRTGVEVDDTWLIAFCDLDCLTRAHLSIGRLPQPVDFGPDGERVKLVLLVLAPAKEKAHKSAMETSRTFATLISHLRLTNKISTPTIDSFIDRLKGAADDLAKEPKKSIIPMDDDEEKEQDCCAWPLAGVIRDVKGRLVNYKSDFRDGVKNARSIAKTISTAVFLVVTILPTSVAYGMLNDANTHGAINVQKVILGQWIGGLVFALAGGQPLLILSTTAPISIYVQVIYKISQSSSIPFYSLYAWTGLYAMILLALYAVLNVSNLLRFVKRSIEEMFSLFIACALVYNAIRAVIETYITSYRNCANPGNMTMAELNTLEGGCSPSSSLLFSLLCFGVFWGSTWLSSFNGSKLFHRVIRDVIVDYALPISVVCMALVADLLFYNVDRASFPLYSFPDAAWADLAALPRSMHGTAVALAVPLSLLFLMDQLLVTKTIDNKTHNLQKGSAYHWDLLLVAILNIGLSFFGLPWMHGALPSAFLHLKALADVEERTHQGFTQQVIVKVRETRLATLLAHLLMVPIYFFLVPIVTRLVPTALFHGLFLFMAFSSLTGNEFWLRMMLTFSEQRTYPGHSWLRHCPQRVVHGFTAIQLIQLIILLAIGFCPHHYVAMAFPIVIAAFVPIRMFILPLIFKRSHLEAIDGEH